MRIIGETFGNFDRLGFAANDGLTGEQDEVELFLLGRVGLQDRGRTVSLRTYSWREPRI